MKKSILYILIIFIFSGSPVNAQFSKLLNKVSKSVTNEITGNTDQSSKNTKQEPEPKCACENPELIFDLGGPLKLMYSEISLSVKDDGSILVKDRVSGNFYIVKNGVTEGPIKEGDPRLAGFDVSENTDNSNKKDPWAHNEYISKSGDKYLIKFKGKSYGPWAQINEFQVTRSKEKFAAFVVENIPVSEADGKKMEEAIKNAKTDQERMDLSMKYSQQMMQKMQQAGGAEGILPKLITNIEGVDYEALKSTSGNLNGNIKYDDILLTSFDKIIDLKGKPVLTLKQDAVGAKDLFVNTANTKYAFYNFGTLTFSDNTIMSDMFSIRWVKADGVVSLAYMYYSPKRNAIMQCKMPF
jgi:hypothetical protein